MRALPLAALLIACGTDRPGDVDVGQPDASADAPADAAATCPPTDCATQDDCAAGHGAACHCGACAALPESGVFTAAVDVRAIRQSRSVVVSTYTTSTPGGESVGCDDLARADLQRSSAPSVTSIAAWSSGIMVSVLAPGGVEQIIYVEFYELGSGAGLRFGAACIVAIPEAGARLSMAAH